MLLIFSTIYGLNIIYRRNHVSKSIYIGYIFRLNLRCILVGLSYKSINPATVKSVVLYILNMKKVYTCASLKHKAVIRLHLLIICHQAYQLLIILQSILNANLILRKSICANT